VPSNVQPEREVTPDGQSLIVQTKQALDPVADTDTNADVYRWTVQSGQWTCLSCQAPGTPSAGDSAITYEGPPFIGDLIESQQRPLSDDGSTASFTSAAALVPQDTNGVDDVYEWKDGTVSLISTGLEKDPAIWVGASADGNDVFFFSHAPLVGGDTDNYSDLYDARIDGGFPQPPPSISCQGDECQGAAGVPPNAPGSGSSSFSGPGNQGKDRTPATTAKKHRKHKKHKKHNSHMTGNGR